MLFIISTMKVVNEIFIRKIFIRMILIKKPVYNTSIRTARSRGAVLIFSLLILQKVIYLLFIFFGTKIVVFL
jgi:hypothetical protein